MTEIIATYSASSTWNTDQLGFDFNEVEDWFVKWDTLYVRFSKDGEYKDYGSPHFSADEFDHKHPSEVGAYSQNTTYTITYWLTEEDRESGEAEDGGEYDNLSEAIKEAKRLYKEYSGVEVYDEEGETIFHRSSDGDEGFLD